MAVHFGGADRVRPKPLPCLSSPLRGERYHFPYSFLAEEKSRNTETLLATKSVAVADESNMEWDLDPPIDTQNYNETMTSKCVA